MEANQAINNIERNGEIYGKSYAMMLYDAIHDDAIIKELYNQKKVILMNRTTPLLVRTGEMSWAINMFSKEQTEQLYKIDAELQERYEAITHEVRKKLAGY